MIQIAPQMRILVAVEAVDFRRGIDGLSRVCRDQLASDPFSGTLFVFHARRHRSWSEQMPRQRLCVATHSR
jgi:transposase